MYIILPARTTLITNLFSLKVGEYSQGDYHIPQWPGLGLGLGLGGRDISQIDNSLPGL